jgi:hypothetical protein
MGIRDISNSGGAGCSALLTPISDSTMVMETETESTTVTAIVVDGSCTSAGGAVHWPSRQATSSRIISPTATTGSVLPRQAPPVMLVVAAASVLVTLCPII